MYSKRLVGMAGGGLERTCSILIALAESHRAYRIASGWFIRDHVLTGPNACIRLVDPGECFEYPDYHISPTEADLISAQLSAHEDDPMCILCDKYQTVGSPFCSVDGDVHAIAHHMWTK